MSQDNKPNLRILLVDDHAVVRVGLRALLERSGGMEVVGEAATQQDAIRLDQELKPDLVILDLRLSQGSGLDACVAIKARNPLTKILILSVTRDDATLVRVIGAGADGYLAKDAEDAEILGAVRTLSEGGAVLDATLTRRLMEGLKNSKESSPLDRLSPQERKIIELVSRGTANKQIATELGLSENTVRHYLVSCYEKLGVRSRTEAAALLHKLRDNHDGA